MRTHQQTAKQKHYALTVKIRVEYNYLKDLQRELKDMEAILLKGHMTYAQHNDYLNKIVRQKSLINLSKNQLQKLESKQQQIIIV